MISACFRSSLLSRRACSLRQLSMSVVKHPHNLNATPAVGNFAVIEFSGTQYKVTEDDVIVADRIDGVDIGDIIDINQVLLVGSGDQTMVGHPLVPGATVRVAVEEITKDKKVITLKFRRRKNSKNIRGSRRELTILRVTDILTGASV